MPILPGHIATGPKGSVFPAPVIGGLVTFALGPFTLSTTTTGQGFMSFRAPFDMKLTNLSYTHSGTSGTCTVILYKHATAIQVSGATTLKDVGSFATVGSIEGATFTARSVSKGEYVFLDPLVQTSATALTFVLTAVATGYPLADMSAM